MQKRSIAKLFNSAAVGEWTDIATEKIKLSNGTYTQGDESEKEINVNIDKYIDLFFTKSIMKKVMGTPKAIVIWPAVDTPFKPVVDRVEVFRVTKSKYVMLIRVSHLD